MPEDPLFTCVNKPIEDCLQEASAACLTKEITPDKYPCKYFYLKYELVMSRAIYAHSTECGPGLTWDEFGDGGAVA